jgi:hypothetical protein
VRRLEDHLDLPALDLPVGLEVAHRPSISDRPEQILDRIELEVLEGLPLVLRALGGVGIRNVVL